MHSGESTIEMYGTLSELCPTTDQPWHSDVGGAGCYWLSVAIYIS